MKTNDTLGTVEKEELIISTIEIINYGFGVRFASDNVADIVSLDIGDSSGPGSIVIHRTPRLLNKDSYVSRDSVMNSIVLLTNELCKENVIVKRSDFKTIVYKCLRECVMNDYKTKKMIMSFILTLEEFIDQSPDKDHSIHLFGKEFIVYYV